jgi:hypothetical protein
MRLKKGEEGRGLPPLVSMGAARALAERAKAVAEVLRHRVHGGLFYCFNGLRRGSSLSEVPAACRLAQVP